ncbi:MAG TPA: hypothetical protein VEV16_12915 [Daejeonella sp.]|nr:hypothetical protein [Daejeonella sp.]
MKKILFLAAMIVGTSAVYAQNYKAFKVDVGFGYAIPSGGEKGGTKAGLTFTVEPHYRLSDDLALGLRFEGAALGRASNMNGIDADVKISALNSYSATGEYYLNKTGFRPFVGAGVGLFNSASVTMNAGTNGQGVIVPGATKFGFIPNVGFETGHFRMSANYNLVSDNGYFAAKIGFFFGGGKKSI